MDGEEDIKAFQLVEFDRIDKRKKRGPIDCVPSNWISFNPLTSRCECKFMQPPYSEVDCELFDSLVKQRSHPPASWLTYPITLKGHATTYDDAMNRLKVLKREAYVYTEDGALPESKAEIVKKAYQRIKVRGDMAAAEHLMRVQSIHPSDNENCRMDIDSSSEASDAIPFNEKSVALKRKHINPKNFISSESTDENSNLIQEPRKKPKPKSAMKNFNKNNTRAFIHEKDHVEATPRSSSKYLSSNKSKTPTSSTRHSQGLTPAQIASGYLQLSDTEQRPRKSQDVIRNRDPKNKSRVETTRETMVDKSKKSQLAQSRNNFEEIEHSSRRSSPDLQLSDTEQRPHKSQDVIRNRDPKNKCRVETTRETMVDKSKKSQLAQSRNNFEEIEHSSRRSSPDLQLSDTEQRPHKSQDVIRNRDPKNKCRVETTRETMVDKSKKSQLAQSRNNFEEIEHSSRRSSAALPKSQTEMCEENSSVLTESDGTILRGLKFDVQALTAAINELTGIVKRSALAKDAYGVNVQSVITEYGLKLPVTTLEEFDAFDEKLKADKKLRKEFASTLHFVLDHNLTLPKNITALLKKCISRDVALEFTAVKTVKNKRIFKETRLCGLLLDVISIKYEEAAQRPQMTENRFYRELGNCLSNAIDWDGHRKVRSIKNKSVVPAADDSRSSSTNSRTSRNSTAENDKSLQASKSPTSL